MAGEGDHEHSDPNPGCTSRAAAPAVRPPRCCAASSPTTTPAPTPLTTSPPTSTRNSSPPGWASLLERPTHAVQARRATYCRWQEQTQDMLAEQQRWIEQHISRSQHQGLDYGLDL